MSEEEDNIGNDDSWARGGEHGFIAKAKACYITVFDNEEQLNRFYELLKVLKKRHPSVRTHGGRIDLLVQEELNKSKQK